MNSPPRIQDRYRPAAPPVHIRTNWEGRDYAGSLCDVSAEGVRLWLPTNVPVGTEMELNVDAGESQFVVHPVVAWTTPTPDGFMIGAQLRDSLPEGTLEELARKGCLERRTEYRARTDIDLAVRIELDGGQRHLVRMVDYSPDGFRLQATCELSPGRRLMIEHKIEGSLLRIPARAVWQVEDDGCYTVGCCLLHPDGAAALEQIVKDSEHCPSP